MKIRLHTSEIDNTRNLFINSRLSRLEGLSPEQIAALKVPNSEILTVKRLSHGRYAVIQGSHRIEVMKKKGGGYVEAEVIV
jgi:uncharacterized ParB-like nuclease family protein